MGRLPRTAPVLAAVLGCLITGCASTSGSRPPADANLEQLRGKLPLLEADECYSADLSQVFPHCDKYVTELASTVGALRDQFAPKGPEQRAGVDAVQVGINEYQRLACGSSGRSPTSDQRNRCPAALVAIHDGLEVLQHVVANLPTTTPTGTP